MISTIEIEEHKLESILEEDNMMVELPTQVIDNEISDTIKSEENVVSTSHFFNIIDGGEITKDELREGTYKEVKSELEMNMLPTPNTVRCRQLELEAETTECKETMKYCPEHQVLQESNISQQDVEELTIVEVTFEQDFDD